MTTPPPQTMVEEFDAKFSIHDWDCPGDAPVDCGPTDESIAFRARLAQLEADAAVMAAECKKLEEAIFDASGWNHVWDYSPGVKEAIARRTKGSTRRENLCPKCDSYAGEVKCMEPIVDRVCVKCGGVKVIPA